MSILVSPHWLHNSLSDPSVKIIDGSWHMPAAGRDAKAEFLQAHLPGAVFFDIDTIADQTSDLPHMLPTPEAFAEAAGGLGITERDTIVVYDSVGLFSAPRVWWTFRTMGARDVRVLNGGLPAWQTAGFNIESGPVTPEKAIFTPSFNAAAVASHETMQSAISEKTKTILDARPEGRFAGTAPEPREGLPSGHMPGALNLPAGALIEEGKLKPIEELADALAALGITPQTEIITTCGSGVTAATLYLALTLMGHEHINLYDGSWTEWASRPGTEIISR